MDRRAGIAAAAVFGEVGHQFIHRTELRGVNDEATVLPCLGQPGMAEFLQVERQRRRRDAGELADSAGGETHGSGLDQCTKDRQTGILGESSKSGNNGFHFHISMIFETWKQWKVFFRDFTVRLSA